MTRKSLFVFLLIALVSFSIFPRNALADVQLSKGETHLLLNSVQQELINKWIDLTTSGNFSEPEKQAALFLIRNAIQKKELKYALIELPQKYLKTLIKISANLIFSENAPVTILDEIEKKSVEKAVEIAIEWLVENEIKVDSGTLTYSFTSYRGNPQNPVFYYNLAYHPLNEKEGELSIEFYSPEEIEPQESTGNVLWLNAASWEFDAWRVAGNEKLGHFIVRIKGKVTKIKGGGYIWSDTSVVVTFSEPVPELPVEKPLSFWEKVKKFVVDLFTQQIQNVLHFNPFSPAAVVQVPLSSTNKEILADGKINQPETEGFTEIALKQDSEKQLVSDFPLSQNEKENSISEEPIENKPQEEITEVIENEELEEIEEIEETETTEESKQEETLITICERTPEKSPTRNKVIINEIAWMGTTNSASDEWVELKNLSNSQINLAGWQILDKEKQVKVIFAAREVVPSKGFYLLERTDDDSVPGVTADKIYTGRLSNTEEALYLFDENCQLQDEASANPDWPDGDNGSKRTMERKSNLDWQTSSDVGGTPKRANSSGYYEYYDGGGSGGNGGSSDSGSSTPAPDTESPVANAGPDQTVEINEAKTFDGSASTDNVGIISYHWDIDDDGQWDLEGINPTLEEGYSEPGEYLVILRVSDAAGNVSTDTLLVIVSPLPEPQDVTSPAAISNLTAETGDEEGEILLSWTAPGDDGNEGRTTEYIIKHSQKEIIESDWDISVEVSNEIIPQEAGSKENLAVFGLTPGATYFFAIKSKDDADNLSGISNSTSAQAFQTLPPPKILISEIQIEGLESVRDEFIELYNPNDQDVYLTGFALKKKTSGGSESNLVSSVGFSGTIASLGYFLIVPQLNDDGSPNYQGEVFPDLYYSGKDYSIAADNTILLYDRCNNLVDKVGWGEAQDFETAPAENPSSGQSLGRKWDEDAREYQDTDDNSQDFEIQPPTPGDKNQPLPPEEPAPPEISFQPAVGHNDPEGQWENEPLAYDGNGDDENGIDTFAICHVPHLAVSSWLELIAPAKKSQGIRFWIDTQSQMSFFRVELLYQGSWHCHWDRSWPDDPTPRGEWVMIDYPEKIVEKARVRFGHGVLGRSHNDYLNEFQFKTYE